MEANARDVHVGDEQQVMDVDAEQKDVAVDKYPGVRVLTQDELNKYTIFDVVMPMPGCDINFPEHEMNKEYYERFMKERDDITLKHFADCREYYAFGAYRTIMKKPIDVKWNLKRYTDNKKKLVDTDVDKIKGVCCDVQVNEDEKDSKIALVIEFTLETSTYATMFLRELLRVPSTSLTTSH